MERRKRMLETWFNSITTSAGMEMMTNYYDFNVIALSESVEELFKEWETIQLNNRGYEAFVAHNKLIRHFQFKEFYKQELKMWKENKEHQGLPLRSWIYYNRKKSIGKGYGELTQEEIMRAFKISGIHIGNSYHSPMWIKQFCLDHNVESVYDPCGGWGHRMLGAASTHTSYIYNDINSTTMSNCKSMAEYLQLKDVKFYDNDAAQFTPDEDYDAVFTCPPYHNVEWYSEKGAENLNYYEFLQWWKQVIESSCLRKESCKLFAFIINHTYERAMKDACLEEDLRFVEEHILGSSRQRSHLNSGKEVKKYEKLLVFEKK